MQGFLIDVLKANGWQRLTTVYFRFRDAERIAKERLTSGPTNRAVRIVSATIGDQSLFTAERPDEA